MTGYRFSTLIAALGLVLAAALGLAGWSASGTTAPTGTISATLLAFSCTLLLITTSFSRRNLAGQAGFRRFGWLLAVCGLGLVMVMGAANPIMLALGWTVSGWAAVGLVGHAQDRRAHLAQARMARWMLVSDLSLWAAVILAATTHLALFGPLANSAAAETLAILLVISGVIRSSLIPARGWLLGTLEAPTPVSALLHAGVVAGFGVLLLRMPVLQHARWLIAAIALGTIGAALITMRHRHDEKGKLATGTSMQMAFMSLEGITGIPGLVLLHVAGHGCYKAWSFLRASGVPIRLRQRMPVDTLTAASRWLPAVIAVGIGVLALKVSGPHTVMNLSVATVCCYSALRYAQSTPARVRRWLSLIVVIGMASYTLIVHSVVAAYGSSEPPVLLIWLCASALVVLPALVASMPMTWTLRWAARTTGVWHKPRLSTGVLSEHVETSALVEVATSWIQPSRPLSSSVADNPMIAWTHLRFDDAGALAAALGIAMYASPGAYLQWYADGHISDEAMLRICGSASEVEFMMQRARQADATARQERSPARVERTTSDRVITAASWWCSQAWHAATQPSTKSGCYQLWHGALPPRIRCQVPADPTTAIQHVLQHQAGPHVDDQLRLVQAWAMMDLGWLQVAMTVGSQAVLEVLALRAQLAFTEELICNLPAPAIFQDGHRWQEAMELTYRNHIHDLLRADSRNRHSATDPSLTAEQTGASPHLLKVGQWPAANDGEPAQRLALVTCIDVRSDVLRSEAEKHPGVTTFGMAGFFGAAVRLDSRNSSVDLCPVIVTPTNAIPDERTASVRWALPGCWAAAGRGVGALALAEAFGVMCGLLGALNTWRPRWMRALTALTSGPSWFSSTGEDLKNLPLTTRLEIAQRLLDVVPVANFDDVVIVGHGSHAPNTAFASTYQCGACGGKPGHLNARIVASILTDPDVRRALSERGHDLGDTRFWAGLHETAIGTVELDPNAPHPLSPNMRSFLNSLQCLPHRPTPAAGLQDSTTADQDSATAWWQTFPEWGLAGNAACVIGSRRLTVGHDLDSRVFLHDYDFRTDPDGQRLLDILSGPGVVMQMISMQYYMSLNDPELFGSGDKTRQNVLGEAGVLIGSGGRLRLGLPWQALSQAPERMPAPIRLQFFIDAPEDVIHEIVSRSPLAEAYANSWIRIESIFQHHPQTHYSEQAA